MENTELGSVSKPAVFWLNFFEFGSIWGIFAQMVIFYVYTMDNFI